MADEQERAGASAAPGDGAARRSPNLLVSVSAAALPKGAESALTVLVALAANLLVAVAKSVAAALTGSASILAEAAHSWAGTGNEVFLLIANRRSYRPPDRAHPLGYGREAYVWSCSRRSACSWPAPPFRSRTESSS